jgi:hypothetical protein
VIPQRSSRAEVPGQQVIDVVRLIVKDDLDGVTLWSRVEYNGANGISSLPRPITTARAGRGTGPSTFDGGRRMAEVYDIAEGMGAFAGQLERVVALHKDVQLRLDKEAEKIHARAE